MPRTAERGLLLFGNARERNLTHLEQGELVPLAVVHRDVLYPQRYHRTIDKRILCLIS